MTLAAPKKGDRLFRAMVLMGGSMALGCGGNATKSGGGPTAGSGGSGDGSGGTGGTGPGAGGTGGTGILLVTSTSTTGVAQVPVEPGPFPCVPAQFDCSATPPQCSYPGWQVPENCRCDDTRPKSASDCAPDQTFVCRQGMERYDGAQYTEVVPFECTCVPAGNYCQQECSTAFSPMDYQCERAPSSAEGGAAGAAAFDTLCGCAVIVLR